MNTGQDVDALLSVLEETVNEGLSYFEGPGLSSELKIGLWTSREVLCHMVYGHQSAVDGIESVLSKGSPYRIYASTDEMNARAIGRASGKPVAKLSAEVRELQVRLSKSAREMPDPNTIIVIRGDGSEISMLQRLERMANHWKAHLEELKG